MGALRPRFGAACSVTSASASAATRGFRGARGFFTGLSFDGLRLTYATDILSVDAFATILAESGVGEQDGDTYYGSDDSAVFDLSSPQDTWTLLTATGTVPAGATKVQAAIERITRSPHYLYAPASTGDVPLLFLSDILPFRGLSRAMISVGDILIALGVFYRWPLSKEKIPNQGDVSCYAWGSDYHRVVIKKVRRLREETVASWFTSPPNRRWPAVSCPERSLPQKFAVWPMTSESLGFVIVSAAFPSRVNCPPTSTALPFSVRLALPVGAWMASVAVVLTLFESTAWVPSQR